MLLVGNAGALGQQKWANNKDVEYRFTVGSQASLRVIFSNPWQREIQNLVYNYCNRKCRFYLWVKVYEHIIYVTNIDMKHGI